MSNELNRLLEQLGEGFGDLMAGLSGVSHNRYTLTVDGLGAPISVLHIDGDESLNQPWRYVITFTCTDKTLSPDSFLNQKSTFSFNPVINKPLTSAIRSLSDLPTLSNKRTLHGVITEFSQLSVNKDEAHYQVVLSSCLARLAVGQHNAIFQNQSVVSVVEEVLRSHGLTGIDYRLELKDSYPEREFITQWQESDLEFIQRLLADVGIWFRFETHAEHNCDVMVLSDYEQGYAQVADIDYKLPSGMADTGVESVWDISLHSEVVVSSVKVQDYNYRDALADLQGEINTQPKDLTTYGTDYRYAEHYKGLDSNGQENPQNSDDNRDNDNNTHDNQIESGQWYARIRHEQAISQKIILKGKSNRYNLAPGQWININGSPLADINDGVIILSVQGQGNRTDAYELTFTAIPYQALKPYRPAPIRWPQVSGTLPARVTSPNHDTYGYIDPQGRYRVKFNVDLKQWKSGTESLWVRLAKPYAGNTYGFHFPLIDGTEVAIAFMNGNPDRPYIAHAMHDSAHPDLVTTINKHRNVIRTPANNKLRMDDKRGQEHIKLATEYGKTQLNIGHLVNEKKQPRGEGFELRTDEWGAIRAGKGLYITSEEQTQASHIQLQMDNAIKELAQATEMVKRLNELAEAAKAELADLQTQKQLFEQSLKELKQPGILTYAPAGMADVTPSSIQHTAGENIIQTAQNTVDVSAFKRFMVTAGNMISLFANKMGIKLFASQGNVEIQAQNDEMQLSSKQNMTITSTDSEVIISAKKKLVLACDDVAIVIENGGIKMLAPGDVQIESASFRILGPANYQVPEVELPKGSQCSETI
ncbi:type VI secretion system Vgr family protein [Gilliamella sp. Bim3-2]|uniref:type VI secretion system Vgr family protein n=1 Tax=Gilliamella sp. Bim3-2 TaxID=3120235 RepID=UPI0009BDE5EA|nr:type VI secretion system Vgr family protein [Gilliamella apicola]